MTNINGPYADFKSGYVSILGAPNAGKSTLLNRMLGEKISITSKKPQTTRNRILGVLHGSKSQMVFFDTPGVFQAQDKLNVRIVDAAFSALGGCFSSGPQRRKISRKKTKKPEPSGDPGLE